VSGNAVPQRDLRKVWKISLERRALRTEILLSLRVKRVTH